MFPNLQAAANSLPSFEKDRDVISSNRRGSAQGYAESYHLLRPGHECDDDLPQNPRCCLAASNLLSRDHACGDDHVLLTFPLLSNKTLV